MRAWAIDRSIPLLCPSHLDRTQSSSAGMAAARQGGTAPQPRLFLAVLLLSLPSSHAGLYSERDDVQVLSADAFDRRVLKSDEFWIIEWFANWCGGCRMVSPWYKEAATKLKAQGIQFGAMDMDVHGKLGSSYGVSGMPHIMAFLPGDSENPVGMGGLGGAASIISFAEEQFASLSEDQRKAALAATVPAPALGPRSTKTEDFFASLGLEDFSAAFSKNGHVTTASLSALDAYDLGELGTCSAQPLLRTALRFLFANTDRR